MCKERLESNITGSTLCGDQSVCITQDGRFTSFFYSAALLQGICVPVPLLVRDLFISRDVEEQGDIR